MENQNENQNENSQPNFGIIILSSIILNMVLGVTNRILQIVDYCIHVYNNKEKIENLKYNFISDDVKIIALTFCILPTIVSTFMISLYTLLHKEKYLTPIIKIKNFFLFILSMECLFPIGVHISLRTKYSFNSDNPLITMRLINALHFMLVALPQLLIVSINCSAEFYGFHPVDIASLIFSIIFMIWSIGYYFICIIFNNPFDDYISEFAKIEDNDKND